MHHLTRVGRDHLIPVVIDVDEGTMCLWGRVGVCVDVFKTCPYLYCTRVCIVGCACSRLAINEEGATYVHAYKFYIFIDRMHAHMFVSIYMYAYQEDGEYKLRCSGNEATYASALLPSRFRWSRTWTCRTRLWFVGIWPTMTVFSTA